MSGATPPTPAGPATPAEPAGPRAPASPAQLEAMVSLLTDSSESVVERCRAALLANGSAAEAPLRARLALARGDEHRLLRRVLADLRGPRLERELLEHLTGAPDLEQGSILIGRLVDGGSGPDGVSAALDSWAEQVREELPGERDAEGSAEGSAEHKVDVLRRVLAGNNGLQGAPVETARLTEALLHGVTTHRRGMPLPLCIVWLLVARRLGLPLLGVNMPGHMLVRYDTPGGLLLLDPFHKGAPMKRALWRSLLVRQGLSLGAIEQFDASDLEMLARTLRNVLNVARRDGERVLAERVERLLLALAADQAERADAVDDPGG